jgi:hypothetical protein
MLLAEVRPRFPRGPTSRGRSRPGAHRSGRAALRPSSKRSFFLLPGVVWRVGEFGARNSPRAGPNHPRGVRTEYNRRLARRRPPGGAAPPSRVRGEWCWVWCTGTRYKPYRRRHTKVGRPTRPSRGRTGERGLDQASSLLVVHR